MIVDLSDHAIAAAAGRVGGFTPATGGGGSDTPLGEAGLNGSSDGRDRIVGGPADDVFGEVASYPASNPLPELPGVYLGRDVTCGEVAFRDNAAVRAHQKAAGAALEGGTPAEGDAREALG